MARMSRLTGLFLLLGLVTECQQERQWVEACHVGFSREYDPDKQEHLGYRTGGIGITWGANTWLNIYLAGE